MYVPFLQALVFVAAAGRCLYDRRERKQSNDVRDDHELIEHIRKLPDEVIGQAGAEEDEHQREHRIDLDRLFAEEIFHIDLAEEVPAEDRGEREEQQADRDEERADALAEAVRERELCHVRLAHAIGSTGSENAIIGIEAGNNDESRHGEDDKGIDEQTDHGDYALIVRLLHVRHSVRMRGRAHTCFVGKQAALDTLADSGLECIAEAAADDGIGLERVLEDQAESLGNEI